MPARSLCWAVPAIALLGAASGCSSKATNYVKVSGIVTLEGVPLEGAKVTYYPSSGAAPALGITDRAGRFELSTFDLKTVTSSDGALPGEYKVTVELPSSGGRSPDRPDSLEVGHFEREKTIAQRVGKAKEAKVLHANYADVSKTPLKQVIPPQGPVELKLTKSGT